MIKETIQAAALDAIAPRTLDRLLLDETNHRVANEVASALAAMRIAQSSRGKSSRARMIDVAIDRLEAFGECSRIFASVPSGSTDVGALVESISLAMLRSRIDGRYTRLALELPSIALDGETARRIAMIAYELVNNALKHTSKIGGELEVRLDTAADGVVLSVTDNGPGYGPRNSSGPARHKLGGRIVSELISASGGHFACTTGPGGTAVRIMLPTSSRP